MAKKLSLSDLTKGTGASAGWAAESRRSYLEAQNKRENALAEATAAAEAMRADGVDVSDSMLRDMASQIESKGSFDVPEVPKADFSGVSARVIPSADTPVIPEEQGFLADRVAGFKQDLDEIGNFVDAGQAGLQRTAAAGIRRASLSDNPLLRTLATAPGMLTDLATGDMESLVSRSASPQEAVKQDAASLMAGAEANQKDTKAFRENLASRGWLERNLGEGVLDALGSPTSAASIFGGPVGGIAIVDAYNQSYVQAIDAGVKPDDAELYALSQAAPELVSLIPAEKVLGKIPYLNKLIVAPVKKAAAGLASRIADPAIAAAVRTAKTAVGEGIEESGTGAVQDLASYVIAGQAEGKLKEFAETQAPKSVEEFIDNRKTDFRAGLIMGGGIGAPTNIIQEQRRYDSELESNTNTTEQAVQDTFRRERDASDINVNTALDAQLAEEFAARRVTEETDAAFTARDQSAVTDEQRIADEKEAGFRTIELEDVVRGQTRLERDLNGGQRVPVNPAAEVTPEQVAAEREATAVAEQERVSLAAQNTQVEAIAKERAAVAKEQAKAETKKTTAEKAAERVRAREVTRKLIAENPDATDLELADLRAAALATTVVEEPPTKVEATVAAAAPTPVRGTPAPSKPDANLADPDIAALADSLGGLTLGMQENTADVIPVADVDMDAFKSKSRQLIKNLVTRNSKSTTDVQNLLRQGKIVVAPSAGSIGRGESNNVAEFDTVTGKMYLYTDKVNPDDVGGVMARALHEATHAGQFNDREGRSDIFAQMMSKDNLNAASTRIRVAADKGNKVAIAAVQRAKAASPDAEVEALELVPYFVTEAVQAREGTLGQMRGVANDVLSAGRKFLNDKLGSDFSLSLGDLDTAAQNVGGEIVDTTLTPTDGGTLGMIGGRKGTGSNEAEQRGLGYEGKVDAMYRYAFSDKDATINTSEVDRLRNGATLSLDLVLQHPELYKQYPNIGKDVKFTVDDSQARGFSAGLYNGNTNTVYIGTASLDRLDDPEVRNTILHEVQHAIQDLEGFIGGENNKYLEDPAIANDFIKANDTLDSAIGRFELGRWAKTAPADIVRPFMDEAKTKGLSTAATAEEVLRRGLEKRSTDRAVAAFGERVYTPARNKQGMAARALNTERNRAFNLYMRNYGEAEARTTEFTSTLSQEELDSRPFESRFVEARGNVGIAATLDTTPFGKGRNLSSLPQSVTEPDNTTVPTTLGMAAAQSPEAKRKRRMPAVITGLFDPGQGTGKDINAIVENARTAPAAANMLAEASLGKYARALDKLAAAKGTTPKALSLKIQKEIDALDKTSNSYKANKAAFDAVASQYGDAGKALMELRDATDQLSLEIARSRAAISKDIPLTETEKERYKALLSNLGRYTHRQYAAMTQGAGKKYSSTVWDDYKKYKEGKGKARSNPRIIANYNTVANAVNFLVDKNLNIPDDSGLADLDADAINSLYDTWLNPAAGRALTLDQKKDALATVREDITPERLTQQAETTTQELLGLVDATGPITAYYRGGKTDRGILQERKDVPPELRKLLGEIVDPSMRLLLTVGKQAEFVARNKMLMELRNQIGIDIQPPDAVGSTAAEGMTPLSGEGYGPLEGYLVSTNMRNLLGDVIQQLATFEQAVAMSVTNPKTLSDKAITGALGAWGTVAATSKMLQIVGNPANFLLNFVGAPMTMLLNGNINPKTAVKAWAASANLIAYAYNPSIVNAEAVRMNSLGITDSAFVGEIKSGQYKQLANLIKDMSGKPHSEIVAKLITAKVGATELYAMMDVWSKMANFYQQVDVLTDFYKKNGDTVTPEMIDREAADNVNRTNITYKRAAPLIKAIERAGLTQFGTYFYEVFRSQVGNLVQGVYELEKAQAAKTPEAANAMRIQAAKRITGQITAWSITAVAAQMFGALAFGDDEEEAKALRSLLPDYLYEADFLKIGIDKDGESVLFNVSRFDPYGPITDLMREMINGEGSVKSVGQKVFDLYIAPRVGINIIKAVTGARITRQPTVKQWFPTAYEGVAKLGDEVGLEGNNLKAWTNVAESFAPGIFTSLRDTNARPVVQPESGPVLTGQEALFNSMTYSGFTMYKYDPATAAKFAAFDAKDVLKESRDGIKDLFVDRPNITQGEILENVTERAVNERRAFDKLEDIYKGMIASDMKPSDAAAVLKDNGVSAEIVKQIKAGQFQSQIISKKSIDGHKSKEMAGKTMEQKREVKKKWDGIWDVLNQVKGAVDEGEDE